MENQAIINEAITKAVAEATRVKIQAFVETQSQDQKANRDQN